MISAQAISEALNNIRLIKLAAMEPDIHAMISKLREKELTLILRFQLCIAILFGFINSGPKLAALSTFLTFTLVDGRTLSPAIGFTTLELLSNLEGSFTTLPSAIDALARAATALSKLDDFLDVKEIDGLHFDYLPPAIGASVSGSFRWSTTETTKKETSDEKTPSGKDDAKVPLLTAEDDTKQEEGDDSPRAATIDEAPTLRDIALDLPKGALVLVGGATGAGKSSLVAALMNEIATVQDTKEDKAATLSGSSAALVPQKAWCQHATFRQNVAAFGADVDLKRYRRVLRACALEPDLKLLMKGDKTKIGSRGINLSGGQQARINLARCVYARPDVALLDDPLSAVDAHVAHHIFERAILGELKHATRILVTHQVDLTIARADYIVFIEKGRIIEHGSRSDLDQKGSQRLADALSSSRRLTLASEKEAKAGTTEEERKEDDDHRDDETRPIVGLVDDDENLKDVTDDEKEYRDKGAVKWEAYALYLRAVGSKWLLLVIFTLIVSTQIANFLQSLAMASWISSMEKGQRPASTRMLLYILASAAAVACLTSGFVLRSVTQVKASRRLHSLVLTKVLGSKVSFFDVTPVGRIQNRFSSDFQAVDRSLPPSIYYFVGDACRPFKTIASMIVTAPILLAALPAIILYDVAVARTYIKGARDMKRLSSLHKSPIYGHFSESLQGLPVIRAFRAEAFCEKQICGFVDTAIRCDRTQKLSFYWLGVRMEAFGSLLGGITAILLATVLFETVNPSLSGFVLQYAAASAKIKFNFLSSATSLFIFGQSVSAFSKL